MVRKQTSTSIDTAFTLTTDWQSNISSDEYNEKIAKIHQYLLSGDCYQVNLAQRFCENYTGSEWNAFLTLNQIKHHSLLLCVYPTIL